ncbi:hypothetical protein V6N13_079811 [Hibiscus sabdariffa]
MEKPSDLSGVLPKFPGSHGGQPPDSMLAPSESVVSSEEVQVLERHGSPIPSENMPVTKRGRTGAASEGVRLEDGSEPTDTDTNMGEVDAATNLVDSIDFPTLTTGPSLIPTGHVGGPPKPSFRDSLLGRDGTRTTDHLISELDVEVTDDDDLCGKEAVGTTNNEVEIGRDPKELFGPWMQVTNRRRRAPSNRKIGAVTDTTIPAPTSRGSRFAILQDPLGCEDVECQVSNGTVMQLQAQPRNLNATSLHKGKETITSISHGIGHSGPGSSSGGIVSEHLSREMVIDLDVNPSEAVEKDVSGALLETGKDVASSERVVYSEVTLNKENHTAVRIGEPSEANSIKERRGRVLPTSFRSGNSRNQTKIASALKSNLKQGPKPKKRDDRGSVNPNLAGRISALVSELDKAKAGEAVHVDSRDGNVQWRANGVFDQPGNNPDRV